jgi:hypothetical protein
MTADRFDVIVIGSGPGGVSPAWPFGYVVFERYYGESEKLSRLHRVRGGDSTEPRASRPYTYPPVTHEPAIARLDERLRSQGLKPFHLPLGILPADNPRIQGTIARIKGELLVDGVVDRYLTDHEDGDGLPGHEGAFLACSFWLCDAYALSGRLDEAHALFGLFAEKYDPQPCRQLGNFPQAFSHFALINSAHTLAGSADGGAAHLADQPGDNRGNS